MLSPRQLQVHGIPVQCSNKFTGLESAYILCLSHALAAGFSRV